MKPLIEDHRSIIETILITLICFMILAIPPVGFLDGIIVMVIAIVFTVEKVKEKL